MPENRNNQFVLTQFVFSFLKVDLNHPSFQKYTLEAKFVLTTRSPAQSANLLRHSFFLLLLIRMKRQKHFKYLVCSDIRT